MEYVESQEGVEWYFRRVGQLRTLGPAGIIDADRTSEQFI